MKVKALIGFVGTVAGTKHRVQAGDELEMPKGADWLDAGLVEQVTPAKRTKKRGSKATKSDGDK